MPDLPPEDPTDRLTVFGQFVSDRSRLLRDFRSASTIADLKPLAAMAVWRASLLEARPNGRSPGAEDAGAARA